MKLRALSTGQSYLLGPKASASRYRCVYLLLAGRLAADIIIDASLHGCAHVGWRLVYARIACDLVKDLEELEMPRCPCCS